MTTLIMECTECGARQESEKGEADLDHDGCENTDHGVHMWTLRAELPEDDDTDEEEEDDSWRTTHSDELKRQRGLKQINGVLWTPEGN